MTRLEKPKPLRQPFLLFGAALLSLATQPAAVQRPAANNSTERWVGTWGAALQLTEPLNLPPPPGLAGNTLRQVVHVSLEA